MEPTQSLEEKYQEDVCLIHAALIEVAKKTTAGMVREWIDREAKTIAATMYLNLKNAGATVCGSTFEVKLIEVLSRVPGVKVGGDGIECISSLVKLLTERGNETLKLAEQNKKMADALKSGEGGIQYTPTPALILELMSRVHCGMFTYILKTDMDNAFISVSGRKYEVWGMMDRMSQDVKTEEFWIRVHEQAEENKRLGNDET